MKRAAIYCRVSTEDQEREGTSLDSQLEACLKKAEELGYEVSEEHTISETYSGLSLERPKLNEVRQWVRDREVDAIIAYTLDRLSRDPVHFIILQEEIEKAGAELILITEDVDVHIELTSNRTIEGKVLQLETSDAGYQVIIIDRDGNPVIIPYHAVVSVTIAQ